jgi:hypothetical protein
MISLRLAVPAVLGAAAVAGCFTYFVTPPPPPRVVEPDQRLPPTAPDRIGPDRTTPRILISVQARKSKRQQPSSEPRRRSKSKHRMRRRPPVPMSHPSLGLSPCRRGARSRAHDSRSVAGAFSGQARA